MRLVFSHPLCRAYWTRDCHEYTYDSTQGQVIIRVKVTCTSGYLPGLDSVECRPDKPMLLIRSSHEKQTVIKRELLETESFKSMNRNEESSLPGITTVPSISDHVSKAEKSF